MTAPSSIEAVVRELERLMELSADFKRSGAPRDLYVYEGAAIRFIGSNAYTLLTILRAASKPVAWRVDFTIGQMPVSQLLTSRSDAGHVATAAIGATITPLYSLKDPQP